MITSLYLKDFKCFEELSLPLAPLTLLTGFNAAGKSTALQAILLLAQSLRGGGRRPFIPLNGSLVRLGSPGDVIRHGSESDLEIGLEARDTRVVWSISADSRRSGNALPIKRIQWYVGEKSGVHTLPFGALDNLLTVDTPQDLQSMLSSVGEVVFLSAMRIGTTEVFPSPETTEPVWADIGSQGEFAAWWFERYMDEDVDHLRLHPSESAPSLRKQFNAWASSMFPGAEANAQRITGTSLVRLELRNHNSDEWRRPANIGYGLTYAFPILIAGLMARKGQTILVDSPEAHLHPKGQSSMGRFLAMLAKAGLQVIVETHSDHVLNGVRLAVSQNELQSKDVAIHFFNPRPRASTDPAHITSLRIDTNGGLSEWPEGFFDQAERDLAVLAGWES